MTTDEAEGRGHDDDDRELPDFHAEIERDPATTERLSGQACTGRYPLIDEDYAILLTTASAGNNSSKDLACVSCHLCLEARGDQPANRTWLKHRHRKGVTNEVRIPVRRS